MRLRMRLRTILLLVILSSLLMSICVWIARTIADINKRLGDFYLRGGINEGWEQMKMEQVAAKCDKEQVRDTGKPSGSPGGSLHDPIAPTLPKP